MPYPGRRAHHRRGVKRRHHRAGFRKRRDRLKRHRSRVNVSLYGGLNVNWVRGRRILPFRRRRRLRGLRAVTFPFRAAAKLAALYKLLTKKKKTPAGAGQSRAASTRLHPARGLGRPVHGTPRPGHGTPRPNPRFFFFPPFAFRRHAGLLRQMRHLRATRFAVMSTNFGGNILAPVRGPAYRTGATTGQVPLYGTGRRPRRSGYATGRGPRVARLRTSRIIRRR